MDVVVAGYTVTRSLELTSGGVPATGASLTYTLKGTDGATLLSTVPTETNGTYSVDVDGSSYLSLAGFLYEETWSGTHAGRDVLERRRLLTLSNVEEFKTRWELRHMLADMVDDSWLSKATSAGTTTTLVDTELYQSDDGWRGAEIYIYGGPGRGEARRVLHSSGAAAYTPSDGSGAISAYTLKWSTAMAVSSTASSYYELHSRYNLMSYNRAVNHAIECGRNWSLLACADESVVQTTATEYELPGELVTILDVYTGSNALGWTKLNRYKTPTPDWSIIPGRRVIKLSSPSSGSRLRIIGQAYPPVLNHDDAICPVETEYVLRKAAAHLLASRIHGPQVDPEASAQSAAIMDRRAAEVMPRRGPMPNAIWIR